MAEAEALKSGTQALGTSTIISLAGLAPPALHASIARSLYATRLFNVTVTNVPGPQMTLYALGAPLREILPLVPLAAEHAVGVAILSYDGQVFFGINVARRRRAGPRRAARGHRGRDRDAAGFDGGGCRRGIDRRRAEQCRKQFSSAQTAGVGRGGSTDLVVFTATAISRAHAAAGGRA